MEYLDTFLPPRVASSRLTEQCPSGTLVGIRCGLLLSVAVSTGVERTKVKRATRPQVLYQPHHFHKRLYGHWYLFFFATTSGFADQFHVDFTLT